MICCFGWFLSSLLTRWQKKRRNLDAALTFSDYENWAGLTESSLCLLGTSSQKSLKLTLGSVAGPGNHRQISGLFDMMIENLRMIYKLWREHMRMRTDLVCWCVVALSYRVDSVQETAKTRNRMALDSVFIHKHTWGSQEHKGFLFKYNAMKCNDSVRLSLKCNRNIFFPSIIFNKQTKPSSGPFSWKHSAIQEAFHLVQTSNLIWCLLSDIAFMLWHMSCSVSAPTFISHLSGAAAAMSDSWWNKTQAVVRTAACHKRAGLLSLGYFGLSLARVIT